MHEHNELAIARDVVLKRTSFNFIAAAMMTVFFCVPTFGQSMYVSTYSDVWGDGDYLYACGVTDAYDWGHNGRVSTRITAPNGNYNEVDSGEQSDIAIANVSFPIYDSTVTGEYFVQSEHWQWCPTAFQLEYAGSTLDSITFSLGYSIEWFRKDSVQPDGKCNYVKECDGVTVKCPVDNPYIRSCLTGSYLRTQTPYSKILGVRYCRSFILPGATPADESSNTKYDSCRDNDSP